MMMPISIHNLRYQRLSYWLAPFSSRDQHDKGRVCVAAGGGALQFNRYAYCSFNACARPLRSGPCPSTPRTRCILPLLSLLQALLFGRGRVDAGSFIFLIFQSLFINSCRAIFSKRLLYVVKLERIFCDAFIVNCFSSINYVHAPPTRLLSSIQCTFHLQRTEL